MGIFESIGSQIGSAIDDAVGAVTGAVGTVAGATAGAAGKAAGAAADLGGGVLKAIPSQVEGALGVLRRYQNIIEDQITAPLRGIVGQVTSGVWTGPGADAFVEEVTSLMTPASVDIVGRIEQSVGAVTGALETIEDADKKATTVVSDLADTFAAIF